jgi:hypothetical protein
MLIEIYSIMQEHGFQHGLKQERQTKATTHLPSFFKNEV